MSVRNVLFLTLLTPVFATGLTELTLDNAIDRALAVDKSYKEAKVNTTLNSTAVNAAKGVFFPRLSLDAYASKTFNSEPMVLPADSFFVGQPEIELPLVSDENAGVSLTLTQPIYLAGVEWAGYDMAKKSRKLALEQEKATKEDVIYSISVTYNGVLLAEEALKVAENSYEVANSHLESTREMYDAGLVSEYDVLRAQVEVTQLFNAHNQAIDTLAGAQRGLRLLLDLPEEEEIVLLDGPDTEFREYQFEEIMEAARENRSDLKQLDLGIGLAESNIRMGKTATAPTVVFLASADETSSALSLDSDAWADTYNLTLSFSWPFFDSFVTPTSVKIAKYEKEKLEITRDLAEDAMELEIKGLFDRYNTAKETVMANEETVKLAEKGYDIAEARYNAGLMTNLEVLDANSALTQTQLGYYAALNNYFVTRMDLLKAAGIIIDYYDK